MAKAKELPENLDDLAAKEANFLSTTNCAVSGVAGTDAAKACGGLITFVIFHNNSAGIWDTTKRTHMDVIPAGSLLKLNFKPPPLQYL